MQIVRTEFSIDVANCKHTNVIQDSFMITLIHDFYSISKVEFEQRNLSNKIMPDGTWYKIDWS